MSAKERLEKYLDIELPQEQLLFHVSMVLSFLTYSFMVLLTLLLRMERYVPAMLFVGALITLATAYAEKIVGRTDWMSACFLFLMFFVLLPFMANIVPYAMYDFPIYFLTGIVFITVLFKGVRAVVSVIAVSVIDLLCMYNMLLKASESATIQPIDARDNALLFCRIIAALFIMGTVCGVHTSYRSRVLRREIEKSIAMERQAEQLSYAKDMFLVNVSHEIRTPLNAILGVTELLLDQDVDERIKDSAFQMDNSSKALLSITNELMDFSKLDDKEPAIADKPYYIGDIINELVNMISVRFADYNMELFTDISPDIPEQLVGDVVLVRQLMMTVLAGIVKSIRNGKVFLRIRKENEADNRICLFVQIRVEGSFGYSYKESLRQSNAGKSERDETVIPLPYRLIQYLDGKMYMEENDNNRIYSFHIRQSYVPGKTLVNGADSKRVKVLFYENTAFQGSTLAKALTDMNISFCQAADDDLFLRECIDASYTHIMIAAERYESIKNKMEDVLRPQSVILIGSYMIAVDDVLVKMTFSRPVNCMNLDALLSGKHSSMIRHRGYRGGFICPDAHIMVVDDNIVNLEVATSMLNRYQAKVSVAASGKECLKMLETETVDLIFLDYMMPEMDGIDTLKNIKALGDPKLETVPIVALTANAVSGAREMFLGEGFDEYISKPIERDKFEKVLRSCLPEDMIVYTMDKAEQTEQTEQTA